MVPFSRGILTFPKNEFSKSHGDYMGTDCPAVSGNGADAQAWQYGSDETVEFFVFFHDFHLKKCAEKIFFTHFWRQK